LTKEAGNPRGLRPVRHLVRIGYWVFWVGYAVLMFAILINLFAPAAQYPVISAASYQRPERVFWSVTVPPLGAPNAQNLENYTMILNVTISAPQPFESGDNVTIHAEGCVKDEFETSLAFITVGFNGAVDANNPNSGSAFNGNSLDSVADLAPPCPSKLFIQGIPVGFGVPMKILVNATNESSPVFFRDSGDYPLGIQVRYTNFTTETYNYPDNKITVQSSSAVNQTVQEEALAIFIVATTAGGAIYGNRKRIKRFYRVHDGDESSKTKLAMSKKTPTAKEPKPKSKAEPDS